MNIAPGELVDWLETEESKSVGDDDGGESTGHKSGRRTVEIERTTRCAVSITRSASTSFPRADVSASVQGAEERTSPIYENRYPERCFRVGRCGVTRRQRPVHTRPDADPNRPTAHPMLSQGRRSSVTVAALSGRGALVPPASPQAWRPATPELTFAAVPANFSLPGGRGLSGRTFDGQQPASMDNRRVKGGCSPLFDLPLPSPSTRLNGMVTTSHSLSVRGRPARLCNARNARRCLDQ